MCIKDEASIYSIIYITCDNIHASLQVYLKKELILLLRKNGERNNNDTERDKKF